MNINFTNYDASSFTAKPIKTTIKTPAEYRAWMKSHTPILFREPKALTKEVVRKSNDFTNNLLTADKLNEDTMESINGVIANYTALEDNLKKLSAYKFKQFLNKGANKYLSKFRTGQLQFFNPDNTGTSLIFYPNEKIIKILIRDKDENVIRGYLLDDGQRLIKNYSIKLPNHLPHVFKYADKNIINAISEQLNTDLLNLNNSIAKVQELVNIN